jgi:tRNA pseudouridine32 synthase/23S rRNA pseudouridine746 synthase
MDVPEFPPILYAGRGLVVVDKPAGLAVHPGPRTPVSLELALAAAPAGYRGLKPVHRLDRDTSGCLMLARGGGVHRRLAAAFAEGRVEKDYWAVLDGVVAAEEGVIDAALSKVSTAAAGWRMVVRPDGKAARTRFRVLARREGRSLVRFRPETGRTHQVRVHATVLGAAIVGDPVYGRGTGLLLHARALRLPVDSGTLEVEAPVPARFLAAGFGLPGSPELSRLA